MNASTDPAVDLAAGVPLDELGDDAMITGRVGEEDVLLARHGGRLFAFGAGCTHYHVGLAGGLLVDGTIRCPGHHACFDLATGEALRAPALDPIPCWRVEESGGKAFVRERIVAPPRPRPPATLRSVVIVGGGAAGLAAADTLRRAGYRERLTMVCADASPPCDRPNLSKDYLAGSAPEDWLWLRPDDFYEAQDIELLLGVRATAIDLARREVTMDDGQARGYDALLLATGAEPVRIPVPGADPASVHTLRTPADARAIVARAAGARRAVVVGASFIGLEVAASLRAREIEVHVVGLEAVPMERVLGAAVGRWVRALHEAHGVVFHLQAGIDRVDGATVRLSDGAVVEGCDLVVVGAGVRPALALAEQAGLALDRGVLVDEHLRTSAAGVYAAGDLARWPDPHTGEKIRVEHWAVAEAQGQVAALNMLGIARRYDRVPFFWSQHYDSTIQVVGHAERWDEIRIEGSLEAQDATVRYLLGGRTLAVATLGRDRESLACELEMERLLHGRSTAAT